MEKQPEKKGSRLNVLLFYETWARILSDKYGREITVTVTDKETGEVLRHPDQKGA